jgi:hypothetical protein
MSNQPMYTTYVNVPRQPTMEGRMLVKRKGEQWKPRCAAASALSLFLSRAASLPFFFSLY